MADLAPLSLLFVVKSMAARGGGAEKVLVHVARGLLEAGHCVSLLTFDPSDAEDFYAADPRIIRLWRPVGDRLASARPLDLVGRARACLDVLRSVRPDVAIGFMHSSFVPLLPVARALGIPAVASEHTSYPHYLGHRAEALLLQAVTPLASAITVPMESVRSTFPPALANRMSVIANPVVVAPTQVRREKILLSVGRLDAAKNHATLIEAFGRIAARHPDWRLRIVGDGPLRGELAALAERHGLANRVELPGTISDLSQDYGRAALFAMPSLYESFGLATAEALASGVPAIGFADCPGTNVLIQHEHNGLLVPPGDRVGGLAEALDRLMASEPLRHALGTAAPASVRRFSLTEVTGAWETLLRHAASAGQERRALKGSRP